MPTELPTPPSVPNHGEPTHPKTGARVVHLPVRTRPCWAQPDSIGRHALECACEGTGAIAIKEPRIDAVDAADDGLESLASALEERDENGNRFPEYLGGSIESLMQPPADGNKRGSSGSGGRRRTVKPKKIRRGEERPPRKWSDGAVERSGKVPNEREVKHQQAIEAAELEAALAIAAAGPRRGRKPRFGNEVRTERLCTSVGVHTKDGLREMNSDLATLVSEIMTQPESLAVVLIARRDVAKEAYDAEIRLAAMQELRHRSGEEELPKGGITRIRARLERFRSAWETADELVKCAI